MRGLWIANLLLSVLTASAAEPCALWGEPVPVGELDRQIINEASGIAVSRVHPGRLYHHNDSGDGPYFYVTGRTGSGTQRVTIDGFRAGGQDMEAMSLGPCPDEGDCLFFGVIGDNSRRRHRVEIIVVREPGEIPSKVEPLRHFAVRYPDEPHNAEGLAVDPAGNIFVATKGLARVLAHPGTTRVYKIPAEQWHVAEPEILEFSYVGELDLPVLAKREESGPLYSIVTGFDIAPDGSRFVLLTYGLAYEFVFELGSSKIPAAAELTRGEDYGAVPLLRLAQQEAISYTADGSGLLYSTEARNANASLVEVRCVGADGDE